MGPTDPKFTHFDFFLIGEKIKEKKKENEKKYRKAECSFSNRKQLDLQANFRESVCRLVRIIGMLHHSPCSRNVLPTFCAANEQAYCTRDRHKCDVHFKLFGRFARIFNFQLKKANFHSNLTKFAPNDPPPHSGKFTPKKAQFFQIPHPMTPFFLQNPTRNALCFRSPVDTYPLFSYSIAPPPRVSFPKSVLAYLKIHLLEKLKRRRRVVIKKMVIPINIVL